MAQRYRTLTLICEPRGTEAQRVNGVWVADAVANPIRGRGMVPERACVCREGFRAILAVVCVDFCTRLSRRVESFDIGMIWTNRRTRTGAKMRKGWGRG